MQFLADAPLATLAKHDLQHLRQEPKDYFPALAARQQNTAGRVEIYITIFETMVAKDSRRASPHVGRWRVRSDARHRGDHFKSQASRLRTPPTVRLVLAGRRRNAVRDCPQAFGRIAIANSDAGACANTDEAIDPVYHAVGEISAQVSGSPSAFERGTAEP